MRLFIQAVTFMSVIALSAFPVWAHGVVGKRFFVEPIATEAATINPDFNLSLSQIESNDGKKLIWGTGLALRLTENLGIEIEGEWEEEDEFEGPELVVKYVVGRSELRESIGTIAVEKSADAFGTGFFYGKGFGDFPERLLYLRPLMLQGDVVFHREEEDRHNALAYNFAIYYSIPYLQQFVKDVGIPRPFNRLFPMVEFNYERDLNGHHKGEVAGFIRPGFVWVGKSVQFGLAAVVPMTGHSKEDGDRGVTATMSLYLDDLVPSVFGKPLFTGK
jgi:hypothetical protein